MARHLTLRGLLAVALLAGCAESTKIDCMPGWTLCNGVCEALDSDAQNCGACGNVCGRGTTCAAGQCVTDCTANLHAPIGDRWGATWDGLERAAATLDEAAAVCGAFGGRLPTATEAHRVSATKSGDVGQSYHVNPLWTQAPFSAANNYLVKLSDGLTVNDLVSADHNFRCLCAPPASGGFTGYACNGPPEAPCAPLAGGNAGYSMDADDRVPLNATGAIWECAFVGAKLPSFLTYAEAIVAQLPNGTGAMLRTADATRSDSSAAVTWTGAVTSWAPESNTTSQLLADALSFRCVGRQTAPADAGGVPTDAFIGANGIGADAADRTATSWAVAHDACIAAGGHLPYAFELGTLIQRGLPAGSDSLLWTADQEGLSTTYQAAAVKWTGADTRYLFAPANVDWLNKADTTSHAERCVYYPVDPSYAAPTGCFGGCLLSALGGTRGAKVWLDTDDRNAASLISAIDTCRSAGGHLATERDLTEAIRFASLKGSGAWIHAADVAGGAATTATPVRGMQVKWSNVNTSFTDQATTYSQWGATLADSVAFRCAWTNEIR